MQTCTVVRKISPEGIIMRSPKWWCVLVTLFCVATGPVAFGQSAKVSDDSTAPQLTPKAATEDEVQQLRREVAELKAQIQRLPETGAPARAGRRCAPRAGPRCC